MYIHKTTKQYPVSENDIRLANPNTSFPAVFQAPEEYSYVFPSPKPDYNQDTQNCIEGQPQLLSKGNYEQTWVIQELPADVITANLAAKTSQRWEDIKQIRDTKVQTGGYKAANKWFHSDTFSRTQQMGLVMLGANLPAGMQWKTMDSTFITMTPSLAAAVFQAAAMQDSLLFKHAEVLKADTSLDINQGWPTTYGG